MKFTISPHLSASRMRGRFSFSRSSLTSKLPLSLRTSTVQSQRKSARAEGSDPIRESSTTQRDWKDRYLEQVKAQAKKDCAAGVHMGDDYKTLEQDTMAKYVSSTSTLAQNLFRRESAQVYTAAWNEAKAAQSSPKEKHSGLSGFDKRV